ncbi:Predicted lipid-binding transport protein, Tim44 family [Faunimonas pinastri]|uniref:Predicted lipid-binding transport protein, Tim44 family n=1 Tax=Faunimonas pinastri TaxID=1855383 RepID=A0A1H9MGA0_9HYPH|nr:Tim44 domain-containing protein [Faunimonas pinastri]SER22678.1 Predicted lipid-binding transport protein, Tim44 family [Faunimonas pinastri]
MSRTKVGLVALALAASLALSTAADARAGRGGSFGSRGGRTWSMPPSTRTAPNVSPLDRSMTQRPNYDQRGTFGTNTARPGMFGRPGFMGGLFAGMLGAGLFGALFGHGFFGGIGGMGSIFGLLLQFGLIFLVVRWAMGFFGRRSQPAFADRASPASGNGNGAGSRFGFPGFGGIGGGSGRFGGTGPNAGAQTVDAGQPIAIGQADLDTFEKLLVDVQTAYGREDLNGLRALLTPEMLSEFADELAANNSQGIVNRITDVKLLQGDPAEAWQEGAQEYATVAMRFGLRDVMEDRNTGRIVETNPSEATELWTFRRAHGGRWLLSAIQQG